MIKDKKRSWIYQLPLMASLRGFEPPASRLGDGPSAYIPYQQG